MDKPRDSLVQRNDRRKFRWKRADAGRYFSHIFIGALTLDDQLFIAECEIVVIIGHFVGQPRALGNANIRNIPRKFHAHEKRLRSDRKSTKSEIQSRAE